MLAVRELVAAVHRMTHAVHAGPADGGADMRGPAAVGGAGRAVPPMPVRPRPGGMGAPDSAAGGVYGRAGVEPPLDEVLHDPIVRALMRSDRLRPEDVVRRGRPTRGD